MEKWKDHIFAENQKSAASFQLTHVAVSSNSIEKKNHKLLPFHNCLIFGQVDLFWGAGLKTFFPIEPNHHLELRRFNRCLQKWVTLFPRKWPHDEFRIKSSSLPQDDDVHGPSFDGPNVGHLLRLAMKEGRKERLLLEIPPDEIKRLWWILVTPKENNLKNESALIKEWRQFVDVWSENCKIRMRKDILCIFGFTIHMAFNKNEGLICRQNSVKAIVQEV